MSTNSESKSNSLINIQIPDFLDKAAENLSDKPTETMGEVLSDCLF